MKLSYNNMNKWTGVKHMNEHVITSTILCTEQQLMIDDTNEVGKTTTTSTYIQVYISTDTGNY